MDQQSKKQSMTGKVVSDKMDKTVIVKVDSKRRHKKYKKIYTVSKKFKAHDENNEYKVGDTVVIESIKPKSKDKSFQVIKSVKSEKKVESGN